MTRNTLRDPLNAIQPISALGDSGQSKMSRRALLAASLVGATVAASCGGGGPSGGTSSGPAEMTFWNGFTASDRKYVEQIVRNYNQSSKNHIDMTIEPWDTIYQKLQTSLATGQGPDMTGMDPSLVAQYASNGLLQPLDDLYGPGGIDKSIVPQAFFNIAKVNGHIYAAPMTVATVMLYYNKDLFKAAGISSPPKTIDEMLADAAKLTKKTSKGQQYGLLLPDHDVIQWWALFAWAYGGDIVSSDHKSSKLTDAGTVQGFQAWADAQRQSHISPVGTSGAEGDQLFQTQKAAMEFNGPWVTSGFTQAGVNYDVVPVPVGSLGKSRTLAAGAAMAIGKPSKYKKQDEDFIKYWYSKKSELIYAKGAGSSPGRTDMLDQLAKLDNPYPAKFAAQLPNAAYYLAGLKDVSHVGDDIITPAVQSILRGADVQKTLSEANSKLNEALAQG